MIAIIVYSHLSEYVFRLRLDESTYRDFQHTIFDIAHPCPISRALCFLSNPTLVELLNSYNIIY